MVEIVLINIKTDVHWQLACQAAKHAVKFETVKLVYGTPTGDEKLTVKYSKQQITIRRQR